MAEGREHVRAHGMVPKFPAIASPVNAAIARSAHLRQMQVADVAVQLRCPSHAPWRRGSCVDSAVCGQPFVCDFAAECRFGVEVPRAGIARMLFGIHVPRVLEAAGLLWKLT